MRIEINHRKAEALAICGRLLDAAYDEGRLLAFSGEEVEVEDRLADLVRCLPIDLPGVEPLVQGDFDEAKKQIEQAERPFNHVTD